MKDVISASFQDITVEHKLIDITEKNAQIKCCYDEYEILYVINGEGKCNVEGVEYRILPGALLLIFPFTYYTLILKKLSGCEYFSLRFKKIGLYPETVKLLDDMITDKARLYPPVALSMAVLSAFDRFDIAESLPKDESDAYIRALLSEIIVLLSASSYEKAIQKEEELGARVLRYINDNIDKNVSLDKLARHFFVSKFYLCRAFKNHNGVSVHSYINHKRILYAKQLIEAGQTASSAAYKVGFGDYSAFFRAYVKIVGKTPSDGVRKEKK